LVRPAWRHSGTILAEAWWALLPTQVQAAYPTLGVIWVDAHADANTPETSPSMHYHGMPAAHLMGWFRSRLEGFDWFPKRTVLEESRLAYIGLRDIDTEAPPP
jgi:arginase